MYRRTFLLSPLLLRAQQERPRLSIIWAETPEVPESFARESVVFPRAYTACPDAGLGRRSLLTGRFPHAFRPGDPALTDHFASGEGGITIYTAESADGADSSAERTVHVPLAIRWPGRIAPRIASEVLASHVDVLPTLLALAGVTIPAVHGRVLQIAGGRGSVPEAVYAQGRIGYTDEWRMLVRGFDKIVWNLREEPVALYNLADDPVEENNLIGKRDHDLTRDSMMALAREWMRRVEDGMDSSGLRRR